MTDQLGQRQIRGQGAQAPPMPDREHLSEDALKAIDAIAAGQAAAAEKNGSTE